MTVQRERIEIIDIGHGDVEVCVRAEGAMLAVATIRDLGSNYPLGVWNVFTSVHHRREGFGRQVMEAVITYATEHGRNLDLHVYADNVAAVRLYQSLGFVIERTYERDSYRFTEDGGVVHCIGPAHRMTWRNT